MKDIPFMLGVRAFNESNHEIERRLKNHLTALRTGKPTASSGAVSKTDDVGWKMLVEKTLRPGDWAKIRRRAKRLFESRENASGLGHLKREDRLRLENATGGVALRGPGTVDAVDEFAARLMDEMPWLQPLIEVIWRDMRLHLQRGGHGLRFRPTIVVGPPGIGKSHFARRVSELANVPSLVIDVGGGSAGFSVAGVQRGWSTEMPGRPVETVLAHSVGNPLVVIDEICKAGIAHSTSGPSTSILISLLGLLEPISAQSWECPYYKIRFDMSHICWLLTANQASSIPEPLLSRCRVINLGGLTRPEMLEFTRRQGLRRGLGEEEVELITQILSAYPDRHPDLNLRTLTRHLDDLEAMSSMPLQH